MSNPPLDSKEGMEQLVQWARTFNLVLAPYHEEMAARHGVSLDGIVISRPLPIISAHLGNDLLGPLRGDY